MSTEIDVKTSIEKFAKEMLLYELDYKKEKKNNREMILLVDHSGAMVAFESWIEQLKDILRGSIAGRKLSTYYFYNVPLPVESKSGTDYKVFNSTLHLQPKLISEMVSKMSKNTDIVIYSDAGVFENIKDYEKAGVFFAVYSLLKRRTNKILWVNPFAEERWAGNTAEMITSLIPMIGYNLDEMRRGVKILKG